MSNNRDIIVFILRQNCLALEKEKKMKKTRTNLVLVLLAAAIFFGLANARPDAPPHSIVAALQGIQEALLALSELEPAPQAVEPNATAVEGYCEYLETAANSSQIIFTVPLGKQFVLRKLHIRFREYSFDRRWCLETNDRTVLDGGIVYNESGGDGLKWSGTHDFPDKCVVINAGEILKVVNEITDERYILKTTIIGYFRDI